MTLQQLQRGNELANTIEVLTNDLANIQKASGIQSLSIQVIQKGMNVVSVHNGLPFEVLQPIIVMNLQDELGRVTKEFDEL